MDNLKKIGLSALAGSLVSFSAVSAGELTVSGAAKITYSNLTGSEDGTEDADNDGAEIGAVGTNFGLEEIITFSGSGELENGMVVSLTHTPHLGGGDLTGGSTSTLSVDMGDMGTLSYTSGTGNIGIDKLDNVMPTAYEEVTDGPSVDATLSPSTTDVSGNAYEVDIGNGFDYSIDVNDMFTVGLGYSENGGSSGNDDGDVGYTDGNDNSQSAHVIVNASEGLTIYAGTAERKKDDMDTFAVKYAYGPVTAGYQYTEIDYNAANSGAVSDNESEALAVAFAVNENLTISYGIFDTELTGQAKDQEVSGIDVGYSMGGIGIKAFRHKGENMGGYANSESEKTEVAISFAF